MTQIDQVAGCEGDERSQWVPFGMSTLSSWLNPWLMGWACSFTARPFSYADRACKAQIMLGPYSEALCDRRKAGKLQPFQILEHAIADANPMTSSGDSARPHTVKKLTA